MRFPFDDQYEFDYEEEYESYRGMSPKMMALFMEDEINRESKVAPDTIGADKYFIDGFITEEMGYEFWTIARDFMEHHFPRLKEFNDLAAYGSYGPEQSDPESALQTRILSIIYNAAKSGDAYSVELMKYLYKTYHKKEYKQLKRFSKITVPEVFSLAETEDFGCDYYAIARIMGMCVFYGIELHERCSILYLVLGKARKDLDEEEKRDFFCFPDGLFQECYDQVEEWMGQGGNTPKLRRKALENFWRADRFAEVCLQRQGYPEDYLYRCNIEYRGIERLLAQTLAVLKSAYPDEEFSFEEVQIYSLIAHGIDALVSVCDDYHDIVSELFGIGPDIHELGEGLFKPENIAYKEALKAKIEAKPVNIAPVVSKNVKEEDYLKEIEELRRRLREKEEECKHFRQQYEHVKMSLSDAREVIAQNENYMEELIALRNYVYGLSQEAPPITEDKLEDMKCAIAEKSVIIIGGHINWINKLKKEFPNWRYVDANISRANDSKLVEGADMVYFFTDHLSHGTYGKFVKLVRENRIPFGYMHSVNMESLVRQVFEDLG